MSYSHYERLSALDASFLALEDGNAHMHLGSVAIFDTGPLAKRGGGIDFARVLSFCELALRKNDRFQQKLARVPGLGQPIWIDDERFNLRYHVRHACLPTPGGERDLKRLAGRIMSEELDRGKPLWELWFVEGVAGGRFAVIMKIHHSMADGIAGTDLMSVLMGPDPDYRPKAAAPWMPRPVPGAGRLLGDEVKRRVGLPLSLMRTGLNAVRHVGDSVRSVRDAAIGLGTAARATMIPASETPFNAPLGPHRPFDWTRFEIADVQEVKERFGGTLNDVVLAVVAGAVRRFFSGRGLRVDDLVFRALVPVSLRGADERGTPGNRVATLLAPLPLDARDPRRRLERVIATTRELKDSKQYQGSEMIAEIADRTLGALMVRFARLGLQSRAANIVITNVPGPTQPIYLLGAPLREVYPVVPLAIGQTLGIALFSYAGGLYWGFNSDWDVLPDLHDLVVAVDTEFAELRAAVLGRSAADTGTPNSQAETRSTG